MWNKASKLHLPYEVIDNTAYVAELVDSEDYFSDRLNRYPKFQGLLEGVTAPEELAYQAQKGLLARFEGSMPPDEYRERLDHELRIIKKMGFSNYLLIVQEFIDAAREMKVPVGPGRGSAAGSLVAWALSITQIDPIKYDLIFERFLNAGRGATPVIFSKEMKEQIETS
jgi:DNA polymerase-3 subunit alpha